MSAQVLELADKIREKGRQSTAELPPLLREAQRIADDATQPMLARGIAHRAAGNAERLLNRYEAALSHYTRSEIFLETLDEPGELGHTLSAKIVPLFFLGRFEELFQASGKARRLFERLGDRQGIARLEVNLAHAHHRLDQHAEALECSERAVTILEETGDIEGFVAASINSAVTFTLMHQFERAEARYRGAEGAASAAGLTSMVLQCRHNIAYLRYFAGDTAAALEEYAALHREYESHRDEWQLCRCLLDEAEILLEVGDLPEAILAARTAGQYAEKLGLNLEIGRALMFEASAHLRLDRAEEALPLLQDATRKFEMEGNDVWSAAMKLQTAILLGEHGNEAGLLEAETACRVLRNSGLPHRLAMAEIVIGRIQRQSGRNEGAIGSFRSALDESRRGQSQWMQFHAAYELGVSLRQTDPEESRTLLQEAEGKLDSLWNRLGSDDLKVAFLTDRENVYTHLVPAALEDSVEAAFAYSEKSRSRVLREHLLKPGTANSVIEIQARLGPDETIVEYFTTGDDLCIFTLTRNELDCVRRSGAVSRIRAVSENLDRHFASCSVKWEKLSAVHEHLQATARNHLGTLYQELIEPVAGRLLPRVVIVPHGFLHTLPFHSLHDGTRYLSETRVISYAPSGALYSSPAADETYESPLLIAFSNSRQSSSFEEVEEAAQYFANATVLQNPTFERIRKELSVPRELVHIAGHAGIDAVGGRLSWIETPEGKLTSHHLTEMRVRARTLVVTGCQTARRTIRPGDEWLGLMRSFYLSGAMAIVSAFWEIRDEAARRFASEFYRAFDRNNVTEAVQSASTALRSWQSHPYFWAGFGAFVRKTNAGIKPRQE